MLEKVGRVVSFLVVFAGRFGVEIEEEIEKSEDLGGRAEGFY
jgi:hypothetical protein